MAEKVTYQTSKPNFVITLTSKQLDAPSIVNDKIEEKRDGTLEGIGWVMAKALEEAMTLKPVSRGAVDKNSLLSARVKSMLEGKYGKDTTAILSLTSDDKKITQFSIPVISVLNLLDIVDSIDKITWGITEAGKSSSKVEAFSSL